MSFKAFFVAERQCEERKLSLLRMLCRGGGGRWREVGPANAVMEGGESVAAAAIKVYKVSFRCLITEAVSDFI